MKVLRKIGSELVSQTAQKEHFEVLQEIKRELGSRNFKALETALYGTEKAQIEALEAVRNGKPCSQKRFIELAECYKREMAYRDKVRVLKRRFTGSCEGRDNLHRMISRLDNGLERAKKRKVSRIETFLKHHVVPEVSGKTSINVVMVDEPKEVNCHSTVQEGERFSNSSEFRKTDLHVNLHIPSNWWSRVYKRNLALIDGVFNLDISTPLVGNFPKDVEVFAVTCLVSSWTTSKRIEHLFVAKHVDGIACHSISIPSALRCLKREIDLQPVPDNTTVCDLIARAKAMSATISLEDSLDVGSGVWEIKDFFYRRSIDISGKHSLIPLKLLAEKVAREPRREALAVLYRMIKKHQGIVEVS